MNLYALFPAFLRVMDGALCDKQHVRLGMKLSLNYKLIFVWVFMLQNSPFPLAFSCLSVNVFGSLVCMYTVGRKDVCVFVCLFVRLLLQ